MKVNEHGSPADRGSADAYYGRRMNPHWWPSGSYEGKRVESRDMSQSQIDAYVEAYEAQDSFKDWQPY